MSKVILEVLKFSIYFVSSVCINILMSPEKGFLLLFLAFGVSSFKMIDLYV